MYAENGLASALSGYNLTAHLWAEDGKSMAKARLATECAVSVENKLGAGGRMLAYLAPARVNLHGFTGWSEGDKACFLLVAEDSEKAKNALEAAGYGCDCFEVLLVSTPNRPGAVAEMLRKLGDAGIDIDHFSATATGTEALCILRTSDNQKALSLLQD